jgi:WD40 repeat protein
MGRVARWTVVVLAALVLFGACWWGLEVGVHWSRGDAMALAAVPLGIAMTVGGWWAGLDRNTAAGESLGELRAAGGFRGAHPSVPDRFVARPDLSGEIVRSLCAREQVVAVAGIGGAGKSTLAASASADRRVREGFPDGITWLEAGPRRDPVVLLALLARRFGLSDSESGFTTMEQGRDKNATLLRNKRVLIVVDNVWERDPLDAVIGLSPGCTVLFTTRLAELASTFNVTPITVDKLTPRQALELLGRLTDKAPSDLPTEAHALCDRVGNLALGVAMAGAMVGRRSRLTFGDVLALIEQDLSQVRADLYPKYQYESLQAAIAAGISDLPDADQDRYAQLAVFAGRGTFPGQAAGLLWRELAEAEVSNLLAELVDRSLLTAAGHGWYTAHDLQYDVLKGRLGLGGLAAAHARLLDGYRVRYPGGWAQSATDLYLAGALAGHLHAAGRDDELRTVLTDVAWIKARLAGGQLPDLISDYGYADDPLSHQIARALRLSAPIIAADPRQVRGQFVGRLLDNPDSAVANWAACLTNSGGPDPWLVPLTPALTSTTTALEQVLVGGGGAVHAVAIAADGTLAVSGSDDGAVRVWDLATGRVQAKLTGHDRRVLAVAITQDGTLAVSGSDDGTVRVWDLATGRVQAKLTGHKLGVWSVAVTPDGTTAVSGGQDKTVRVWNLTSGREQAKLTGHSEMVFSVAVTADATLAVSGSQDDTMRVWDLTTGREQAKFVDHFGGWVTAVAITTDGRLAVSCDSTFMRVRDLATENTLSTVEGPSLPVIPVNSIAITADETLAVRGMGDGTVQVWNLTTGREQAKLTGHDTSVASVSVTADGTRAVSGSYDGTVRVWNLATGREHAQLTGHDGWVLAMAFTADGTRAVSGGDDKTVRVWDLATGHELAKLDTSHRVRSVAITAKGATAVSGGDYNGTVHVWDLATGRELAKLIGPDDTQALAVAVTPDGAVAVSGGDDGMVRVWNLATGREQARLIGHDRQVRSVKTFPDPSGRDVLIAEVSGSADGTVRSVAVSADGAMAVSGGDDKWVWVWDLATGSEQARLTGHSEGVLSVAVSADGTRAISGSDDGTMRVWDLVAGREQTRLDGHNSQVLAVAVTADWTNAVSGCADGTVRVWDLSDGTEVARWTGDNAVMACAPLPGQPFRIAVAPHRGPPYLLELRGQSNTV